MKQKRPPRGTAYNYNVEKQRAGTKAEDVGVGSRSVFKMKCNQINLVFYYSFNSIVTHERSNAKIGHIYIVLWFHFIRYEVQLE